MLDTVLRHLLNRGFNRIDFSSSVKMLNIILRQSLEVPNLRSWKGAGAVDEIDTTSEVLSKENDQLRILFQNSWPESRLTHLEPDVYWTYDL